MSDAAWTIFQIIYWLALSTWFGGVLFVGVTAPIILRTVHENNPILTNVLAVNLEGKHATLLGGSIVGRIMQLLFRIELACAVGVLIALIGQAVLLQGRDLVVTLVRCVLYLAALAMLIYDWRIVWPAMWKHRQHYLDHADEPDVANPALDEFNRYQGESATILFIRVAALVGIILFSANVRPIVAVPMP